MKFKGYRRPRGRAGVRNHVLILPTAVCASETAVRIAALVSGTVALPHQHGCCQIGADHEQTVRTLVGMGRNPNVFACLVVGLGCEGVPAREVAERIAETGKPVDMLNIQDCGGTLKTIAAGAVIAGEMARRAAMEERTAVDLSELVLGIECGGTDATSGLAANPAVGRASDLLLEAGGTAMLSETTELIGAEHVLARRCVSPGVAEQLVAMVHRCEQRAMALGVDIRGGQPTPGNIRGGISTIEEKSLGCIYKAGTAPVQGVLEYGEEPGGAGLYIMDTPGQDIESITGMLAGGAQLIVFTTGRGTPTGAPVAPVLKVTGNARTYECMRDNIDLSAAAIIAGEATVDEVGGQIFDEMVRVASGKPTRAELLGHREFGIYKISPTF